MTNFTHLQITLPDFDIRNIPVSKLLDINVDNLEETMQHQATLYCTVGLLARDAERQAAEIEAEIDLLASGIKRTLYAQAKLEKRRLVKEEVTQELNVSAQHVDLQAKLRQLQHAASVMATLEESFKQRFGMVQQIAKRRSNELAQLQ